MSDVIIYQVTGFDGLVDHAGAAAYLGEKETQFRLLCRMYPDRLRSFNLLPNGKAKWRIETLKAFAEWRELMGVERAG